jgi:hypothetical protein
LSSQQIEIVALLKSVINKSEDLGNDLINMKKITELSTLAIRLYDIYNFLTQNQLDLIKLSDQFKDHSRYLIKDLSHMLENVTPSTFQNSLDKLYKKPENSIEIKIDLSKRINENEPFMNHEQNTLKEKLVLDEVSDEDDIFFQNYEAAILKPIKPLDSFLKDISKNELNFEQIQLFANMMNDNARLSSKIGFEIIANMHYVIAKALTLIKTRHLMPGKEVIESIRACLIVIVAVVKGKEVDITNYLNKAEEFGNHLSTIKVRE